MSYKDSDSGTMSETGNWNVAEDFSRFKIMKPLMLADQYSMIAQFGSPTMQEELESIHPIDVLKIKGFERLLSSLIMLIDNSLFAIKYKNDKKIMEDYKQELKRIKELIPMLTEEVTNNIKNKRQLKIVDEKYNPLLEKVLEIKAGINEPLNKSHLIFIDKEEFDPKEYKKKIIDQATTKG